MLRDLTEQQDIQERIEEIEAALEEEDAFFGRVKLDAGLPAFGEDDDLPETLDWFAGVFVTQTILEASWERLLRISGQARHAAKPITLALNGDWWPQVLGDAVGMGFSQIIVPAAAVADVKDAVREL